MVECILLGGRESWSPHITPSCHFSRVGLRRTQPVSDSYSHRQGDEGSNDYGVKNQKHSLTVLNELFIIPKSPQPLFQLGATNTGGCE